MKHLEGGGEQPPLTGMDLVLQQELYGMLRFPQADYMADTLVLNALLSQDDYVNLVGQYLTEELSDERAEHMLERARRAHDAYIPKEDREYMVPITLDHMRFIHEAGKYKIEEVLLFLLNAASISERVYTSSDADAHTFITEGLTRPEFPLHELRAVLKAAVAELKSKDSQEALNAYRDRFRKEHWELEPGGERDSARRAASRMVWEDILKRAREKFVVPAGADPALIDRCFEMLEGLEPQ